jgi:hypothetical protein
MNGIQPTVAMNPSAGGPVSAPQPMGQMQDFAQMAQQASPDPQLHLHTYMYDYFLRNGEFDLARHFIKSFSCKTSPRVKQNGVMDMDKKNNIPDDLPAPDVPSQGTGDSSLLESWWQCFWDMYFVARGKKDAGNIPLHQTYLVRDALLIREPF